jgi:membrane associated rhomboid family serine protease
MFDSIWKDIKYKAETGTMVTKIVIANVAVYLFIKMVWVGIIIATGSTAAGEVYYSTFIDWLALSGKPIYTLTHIWVILTHMFVHEGFFHILFNMLWLYWFGNILGDMVGDKKILAIYLLGGLMGALFYMLSFNLLPAWGIGTPALGASAAVMAIVMSAAMVAPEYEMRLLFLGDIKLKWIALAAIVLDLVQATPGATNSGGHIAHLGGTFMGYLFISNLQKGKDFSIPVNNFIKSVTSFFDNRKLKVAYKNPNGPSLKRNQKAHAVSDHRETAQDKLDAILDKIKLKGYDSLSHAEKKFLAEESKK